MSYRNIALFLALFMVFATPCKGEILTGAGASFPYPLYNFWFDKYAEQTGVRITYQAVGSGAGIKSLLARDVDFGATDAFLKDEEISGELNSIIHIPTCLGAVTVTYNLVNAPSIKLTPYILSQIFLGRICNWSDEHISRINPGVDFPEMPITVVHRSESSGTNYIFTNYLTKVNKEWAETVGEGKVVKWITGIGVERNAGMADYIKRIEGSIGYVELSYALANKLPLTSLQNQSGNFISPTILSVTTAADVDLPEDTRIMLTNTPAKSGYPISGFTYLILYEDQCYLNRSKERALSLVAFLWWVIHNGQAYAEDLGYAPLPSNAVRLAENLLYKVNYNGLPLLEIGGDNK